jgi:hypothetical protein
MATERIKPIDSRAARWTSAAPVNLWDDPGKVT